MANTSYSHNAGTGPLVQWQMDIPGLTQMIVSAGARGLKELALAGVDAHSLGCLHAIGELASLSTEFRKRLHSCRQQQRESRRFIYKVIEIGGSTNFLADQLLKTRAGENVLGLFTSILPVLSENEYINVFLLLYQAVHANADSIPGVGQLQKLRAALLPLTVSVNIDSKVLHYHMLFTQYSTEKPDPSCSLPDAQSMVEVIRALRKVSSEEHVILRYHGIQGAAWTACFATEMLGLKACMMLPSDQGDYPAPINSHLEDALVIFYVADEGSLIELCKDSTVEELLEVGTVGEIGIEWTVQCDLVSFFATQNPRIHSAPLVCLISDYTAAKVLDNVASMCSSLSFSVNVSQPISSLPNGLYTFQRSILPAVQSRSLAILETLGFLPPKYSDFEFESDGYTRSVIRQSTIYGNESLAGPDLVLNYWTLPRSSPEDSLWRPDVENGFLQMITNWVSNNKEHAFPSADMGVLLRTVKNAVLFASYMAFTDWNVSLRRMSVDFFRSSEVLNGGEGGNINSENRMRRIQQFTTAHPAPEPLFWSLGQEIKGLVLLRQIPLNPSLPELDGTLIAFQPGHILCEGERCAEILNTANTRLPHSGGISAETSRYHPYRLDIGARLLSFCHLSGGNVHVSFEMQQTRDATSVSAPADSCLSVLSITPEVICEVLSALLVTEECVHYYDTPLPLHIRSQYEWIEGLNILTSHYNPRAGNDAELLFGKDDEHIDSDAEDLQQNTRRKVFYQTVEGDGLMQWLACHNKPPRHQLFILQRDACLQCTLDRAEEWFDLNSSERGEDLCIITGGQSDIDRRNSLSGDTATVAISIVESVKRETPSISVFSKGEIDP